MRLMFSYPYNFTSISLSIALSYDRKLRRLLSLKRLKETYEITGTWNMEIVILFQKGFPPFRLHLIFVISSLKNLVPRTEFFCLFRTRFLLPV